MIRKFMVAVVALALSAWSVEAQPTSITLHPAVTHQTINGLEATAFAAHFLENNTLGVRKENPLFALYKDAMFTMAVNDLGLNRLRVHVNPGIENQTDWFPQYLAGQITNMQKNAFRGTVINDNADPGVINPAGFNWSYLDFTIDSIVKPIRDRLAARGETLHLNVNFVANDDPNTLHKIPSEYAEYMLAIYRHMQQKYGFVPDTWEVVNEPDLTPQWGNWTAQQIGQIIAAAGPKLAQHGFTARFGTPSTGGAGVSISWWDAVTAVPGVLPYVSEYVYHRYAPPSLSQLTTFKIRAMQHDKRLAQLEILNGHYFMLHEDLKYANVSSWQHYTLGAPGLGCSPTSICSKDYFTVDAVTNPKAPIVHVGTQTRFYRQYFKHLRRGAVRYEATTANSAFDPLAFRNVDGTHVVVVKASDAGLFSVGSLPAGTYGIFYTTGSPGVTVNYNVNLPDVSLASAGSITTSIPSSGVLTIYAKSGGVGAPSAPIGVRIIKAVTF